ncbi:hypothetical protein EJ04DRAFT_494369 [Polyplosphaeria fusca]|uniref:YMC020W-like alpha/beta hydrolase domain-containing protein n=1 Tax=Polyplosphaeria fusca TaxID=682080 RepID=A0A9P4QZW1_9PLEO|nr:hypothetical protein EJ04DRAFT_494369 [Polyplosphaeria fusca]
MSPRKKPKPNPKAPTDTGTAAAAEPPTTASSASIAPNAPETEATPQIAASDKSIADSAISNGSTRPATSPGPALNKKPSRKWLGGTGSWRSKAPAVAKLAKESIGVSGGATSELPGEEQNETKDQSPTKFLSKRRSSKGNVIPASMTKLHVSSDGSVDQVKKAKANEISKDSPEAPIPKINEPPLPPDPTTINQPQPANTWAWRSWWSRPDGYADGTKGVSKDAQSTPLPGATPSEETDQKKDPIADMATTQPPLGQDVDMKDAPSTLAEDIEMKDDPAIVAPEGTTTSTTSWFYWWTSTQNAQADPTTTKTLKSVPETTQDTSATVSSQIKPPTEPAKITQLPDSVQESNASAKESSKPSGWAFWSRSAPNEGSTTPDGTQHKQVGEVAVFDTPSQSHPEAAQFNEQEPPKEEAPKEEPVAERSFRSLRGRSKVKSTPKDALKDTPSSSKAATPSKVSPSNSPTRLDTAPAAQPAPALPAKTKQEPPNLLLPEFRNTYRMVQKPTYWQQIRKYFLGSENAMPHLHINPAPPRIKKAVAIGIHGYFPAALLQKLLGQPTGTSVRFANAAAAAIKEWTTARGYSADIELVALEGEGFIAERVNTLWKLLLNWIEQIKEADFILVACHSQGVPVATMLVAKLIQFGCVNNARIGICAMAGINMGPFIEYKTKYLGATAAELFEFSNPESLVSQMYLAALDEVLRYGVRILYVGSIDDQLVSVESSTFSNLSHPYIYRAVFVDGRIHAPDFLTHLIGFVLKLRNLGLPDHGLVRELSPALAGSLYGGEGHSRVYEDPRIYEMAVQHALETTSLPVQPQTRPLTSASAIAGLKGINIPVIGAGEDKKDPYALKVKQYEKGSANQNPYFLPWAMRGLLEEEFVKKELGGEVEELLGMFEAWKPVKKELKEVKFRLEAVRSRL